MAIEFSLSELQLRRRQNTLVAKSISTDGTEGNLVRNFQVLNTAKYTMKDWRWKAWKIFVKLNGSTTTGWKHVSWNVLCNIRGGEWDS